MILVLKIPIWSTTIVTNKITMVGINYSQITFITHFQFESKTIIIYSNTAKTNKATFFQHVSIPIQQKCLKRLFVFKCSDIFDNPKTSPRAVP